jgi:hypothetical protein
MKTEVERRSLHIARQKRIFMHSFVFISIFTGRGFHGSDLSVLSWCFHSFRASHFCPYGAYQAYGGTCIAIPILVRLQHIVGVKMPWITMTERPCVSLAFLV